MAGRLTKDYRPEEDGPKGQPVRQGKEPIKTLPLRELNSRNPIMRANAGIMGSAGKSVNKLYNTY